MLSAIQRNSELLANSPDGREHENYLDISVANYLLALMERQHCRTCVHLDFDRTKVSIDYDELVNF